MNEIIRPGGKVSFRCLPIRTEQGNSETSLIRREAASSGQARLPSALPGSSVAAVSGPYAPAAARRFLPGQLVSAALATISELHERNRHAVYKQHLAGFTQWHRVSGQRQGAGDIDAS